MGGKMNIIAISSCFAIMILSLTSCTLHLTKDISDKLQPKVLYEIYKVTPVNLSEYSKCSLPASVNIISTEMRDENYHVLNEGGVVMDINPKELTNHIVVYMKDAFDKSNIKIDDSSNKIIQVSLSNAMIKPSAWGTGVEMMLNISIPEKQYTEIFKAEDWTPKNAIDAMAFAIHIATWKVVTDKVVQDYILCR
jgi:hypothetical protein